MAQDLDAREVTINYLGGSLTMVVGNAVDLFGEDAELVGMSSEPKTVSVKAHPRTRIIGAGSKTVEGFVYTYDQWPAGSHGQAAGGEPVMMSWEGSQGSWQARVSGPLWRFSNFLAANAPKNTFYTVKGGKPRGPYKKS